MISKMVTSLLVLAAAATTFHGSAAAEAEAECRCVAIAADVAAPARTIAMKADNLFAAGELAAAARLYAEGYAASKDPAFLYAQAQCHASLGQMAEARALFESYLDAGAGATLKYGGRARAALGSLGGRVKGGAGAAVGGAANLAGGVAGGAEAGVDVAAGAGGDLAGSLSKKAEPPKVAKGPAILLGVVAVAAIAAVGIQSISAGLEDDIEFDTKFNLGMGLSGAVVGGTAIYLYGLTAATGATAGCLTDNRTIVTPVAHRGGAGAALATSF